MQLTVTICDKHMEEHNEHVAVEGEGKSLPITFGKQELELDICPACLAELTAMLEPWLAVAHRPGADGRPRRGRPRRSEGVTGVPVPGDTPAAAPPVAKTGKQRQEPEVDGLYHCRWFGGECTDTRDNATGRGTHERSAHDFSFSRLDEKDQQKAVKTGVARAEARVRELQPA